MKLLKQVRSGPGHPTKIGELFICTTWEHSSTHMRTTYLDPVWEELVRLSAIHKAGSTRLRTLPSGYPIGVDQHSIQVGSMPFKGLCFIALPGACQVGLGDNEGITDADMDDLEVLVCPGPTVVPPPGDKSPDAWFVKTEPHVYHLVSPRDPKEDASFIASIKALIP